MSAKHTPGPWSVSLLSKPQLRGYYVCRQIGPTHWEQLQCESGAYARFETMAEAQLAADEANAKATEGAA